MTHTLHLGDALAVLRDLPTASVDAVITDPPYSSGGQFKTERSKRTTGKYTNSETLTDFTGDNRDQRAYAYWCTLWFSEVLRVTRSGGLLLTFTDWRQLPSTSDAIQAGGWVWRGIVPWNKPINNRPLYTQRAFLASCEYVLWASNGQMDITDTVPLPGFYQAAAPRERDHITQKPLDVMRALVRVVPEGGTVLDPFMGAGTTGVAASLEGRDFIGVELTEHYYHVAAERIAAAERGYRDDGVQMVLGAEEVIA